MSWLLFQYPQAACGLEWNSAAGIKDLFLYMPKLFPVHLQFLCPNNFMMFLFGSLTDSAS